MGELVIVEGKTRLKKKRASPQAITPEQVETFFETLADTCNVVRSAKAAGFAANWAYRRRRFDAAFRNGWAAAVREGYSKLELVLLERAMKGTPKLVRTARGSDRVMREYSPRWRSPCSGATPRRRTARTMSQARMRWPRCASGFWKNWKG